MVVQQLTVQIYILKDSILELGLNEPCSRIFLSVRQYKHKLLLYHSQTRHNPRIPHLEFIILTKLLIFKNTIIMWYIYLIKQNDISTKLFNVSSYARLPVVLCGCETRSLTLWEEHRLRLFENRVLRRIFGPKRDEVIGSWRKLHNLCFLPSLVRIIKSRRMIWAGHVARMGEGPLWTRKWTFGFHKMSVSSLVAAQLQSSQEGLSSMELVS
jgi:hypothetical protein